MVNDGMENPKKRMAMGNGNQTSKGNCNKVFSQAFFPLFIYYYYYLYLELL